MNNGEIKRLILSASDDGPALFRSQRELADRVAGYPNSKYSGREKSLSVFLNQVLLGKKPCPEDLARLLVQVTDEALKKRAADASRARSILDELRLLLSADGSGVDLLLARQLKAKEVVIVNPDTIESRGHPRSDEFQEALFLGILHGEQKYTFVLDARNRPAVLRLWDAWYEALRLIMENEDDKSEIRKSEVEEKIFELEESNSLFVFEVEPSWCIVPLVAFDPGSRDLCDIYVWDWWLAEDRTVDEIAHLSDYVTWKWIEDFYSEVLNPRDKSKRPNRIRYENDR